VTRDYDCLFWEEEFLFSRERCIAVRKQGNGVPGRFQYYFVGELIQGESRITSPMYASAPAFMLS
jgi:hypothetical protein